MKNILSKILTFFLTIIVLFSAVSFTVEKHICGDQIFSAPVFGKAEKCGMEAQCCAAENNNFYISKKSCCKDEIQLVNGSIFKKESILKLNNKQQNLTVFILVDAVSFSQNENNSTHFKNYFPPTNTHNFNILYQVFRI